METDAAAEASHVAGKASDAVKDSAHAVQGAVSGVCQLRPLIFCAPPPWPTQISLLPNPASSFLISLVCIFSHLCHCHPA